MSARQVRAMVVRLGMRSCFAGFLMLLIGTRAFAEDPLEMVEFHQLKIVRSEGNMAVGFSVKNLAKDMLGNVFVECAALDGDSNVIDTGLQDVTNLHRGETSFGLVEMTKMTTARAVYKCRVSQVNP